MTSVLNRFSIKTLKARFFILLIVMACVALPASYLVATHIGRNIMVDHLKAEQALVSHMLHQMGDPVLLRQDKEKFLDIMHELSFHPRISELIIWQGRQIIGRFPSVSRSNPLDQASSSLAEPNAESLSSTEKKLLDSSPIEGLSTDELLQDALSKRQIVTEQLGVLEDKLVRVAIVLDETVLAKDIQATVAAMVLSNTLLFLLFFALISWQGRYLLQRVRYLGNQMELAAREDASELVEIKGEDELDHLSEQFNELLSNMWNSKLETEHAIWAIKDANEVLELRVVERTQQLTEQRDELVTAHEKLEQLAEQRKQLIERLTQARASLEQSEKMASVGQLAAGVAHEINNPMGFINANVGLLKDYCSVLITTIKQLEQLSTNLPEPCSTEWQSVLEEVDLNYLQDEVTGVLQETSDGISRVRRIADDLRHFSRESNAVYEVADLEDAFTRTLNLALSEFKHRVQLTTNIGSLPQYPCDVSKLNQVLLNLVMNAAQAIPTDQKGEISVKAWEEKDGIKIEVEDNGGGIAEEHLKRIFDPFFTTKPVGEGTGLGLSICYGIVKEHGGDITVRSVIGEGSCFTMMLPLPPIQAAIRSVA